MPLGTLAARAQGSVATPSTFRLLWVASRSNAVDSAAIAVAAELQRRDHTIAIVAPDGDSLASAAHAAGVAFAALRVGSRFGGALQRRILQRRYRPDAVLAADAAAAAWGRHVVAADAVLGPEAALAAVPPVAAELTDRIALRRALRLPRRPLLVLHVAPLAIDQHHEVLLRALAALRPSAAALPTLAFLGTGPAESDLHVLAQDLGVKEHVLWLGFRHDVTSYIGACDVLVAANENGGDAIRQARAHGTAVVAADTAASRRLVASGEDGWLVQSDGITAWSEVLARVAADPSVVERWAAAARTRTPDSPGPTDRATEIECALHAARLARAGFASRRAALFLDRDGTLVRNVPYNADPSRVELEPFAGRALRWANAAGFSMFVVTNQSAIARGLCTAADVDAVNARIGALARAAGADLRGFYVCPHHPDVPPPCDCRKPAPGLLHRAAAEHRLDLAQSVLIGDAARDAEAAARAGVRAWGYRGPGATHDESLPPTVEVRDHWLVLLRDILQSIR